MKFYKTRHGIEVVTDKNHANPFHEAGIIHKEDGKVFFIASGEGVYLSALDLREIADKIDKMV